jgi:hypothetical protein
MVMWVMIEPMSKPIQTSTPAWLWCIAVLGGLTLGVTSAFAVSGGAFNKGKISVGKWSTDPNVGAQAANPWLRARIARVGLLGLTKAESMYFDRTTDEAGNPLREACTYALSGTIIPTRWWSMTIYGADQMLPRNADRAGSVDATRTLVTGQTTWTGILSAARPEGTGPWLSSKAAGTFSLTLRLYNPSTTDPAALSQLAFLKVELVSCASDSAKGAGQ